MKKFKKEISLLLIAFVLIAGFTSCSGSVNSQNSIIMAGSTSMEKLAKSFGEAYGEKNSDINVSVQGGGSSAGVTSIKDGVADIGMLSRDLKEEEKSKSINEIKIAIDGIALIVNKENPIHNLSMKQIKDIFTGKITNWKEVGGEDNEIVVIGREAGSGTREGFEKTVDIKDISKYNSELLENGQIKYTVSTTKGAIGYISVGYADSSVKVLKVNDIFPADKAVQDGDYLIQRPLILVVSANPTKKVEDFIDYILSSDGAKIIKNTKFIPLN